MKTQNSEILYNAISNIDEDIIISSLNYKPKSKVIIKWSSFVACLCVIAVIFGIIHTHNSNNKTYNNVIIPTTDATTSSSNSADFHLYALPKRLAKNDDKNKYQKVMLSPVKTYLDNNAGIQKVNYTVKFKSDGYPYDERDTSYKGKIINQKLFSIAPDSIEFSIKSETIADYSVKAKNNVLNYQYSTTSNGWEKSFENIMISDDGSITWRPTCERFSKEVLSLIGREEPEYDSDINDRVEYSNAVKEVYDSIENFDDYFGDTITFELHCKNGTTETVIVNISLDKYGKYTINYSIN
ncbi:MAG: hypothetical protein ACI4HL_05575 [Ruminococcus sp.]